MGRQPMTRERWEGIIQCKKDLVEGKMMDQTACPYLDPEIAASWVVSFNAGLDPFKPINGHPLSPDSIFESRIKNSTLIELTKPLFSTFTHWADNREYTLSLDDKDGIALIREGNKEYPLSLQNKIGIYLEENYIGTNAHMLVRRLKRPMQIQGPEHYSAEYDDYIVSAAPILDDNNDLIAILSLIQTLPPNPWESNFQSICSHTLSLLSVMATALENKLKLQKSRDRQEIINKNLRIAHRQLNIALDLMDEGLVVVDQSGTITEINKEGVRILNITEFKSGIYNICHFLMKSHEVVQLLQNGNPVDFEDIIKEDEQPYIINILPVINQTSSEVDGAVLRLHHAQKMNMKAASRVGTKASINFSDIVGESPQLKNTVALAKQLALSPENVLLIGESGTGKELFAQAIHNSYCPQGPFIALNCGALPRNLIESELFGYESGSFTGANRSGRPGKIELAHGGTLLLDEMGDMPYEIQAVLLRVLEDKRVTRIGGQNSRKVDFRLIAATNQELRKMVKEKMFREDLYFRLSVLRINIPPLRERKIDVAILCHHFLQHYCRKLKLAIPPISPQALDLLNAYDWPGNVRQLENAIIYSVNISRGKTILPEHLPSDLTDDLEHEKPKLFSELISSSAIESNDRLSLEEAEKQTIEAVFFKSDKNVSLTARILGISKTTLYRKLRKYQLQ